MLNFAYRLVLVTFKSGAPVTISVMSNLAFGIYRPYAVKVYKIYDVER